MFSDFYGNSEIAGQLAQLAAEPGRLPQTILLGGPEGVGKATLARRFGAALLGGGQRKIEQDDLSVESNRELIADREKWTAEKRNEDPLFFGSHPDFLTFPPDGPLRQISIQQMRLLKERAQFKPLQGARRVFLIDGIDRANEHAANSLLKTLEEPPEHLVILMTAKNAYDLLPTIRSRAVPFQLGPLAEADLAAFLESRGVPDAGRRAALVAGSPGLALALDLESYDQRRTAMLALLGVAAGREPFAAWARYSESLGARKTEKLEFLLDVLYILLEDLLLISQDAVGVRNADIRRELGALAGQVSFDWIRRAVGKVDELAELVRRNIQKSIALDALAMQLRG
ncbi:MAG: AAA family ATPase [Acidobacteriota bacterium]|nr:AAA family ATPase [Acidobacteriota bacterium]